MSMKKTAVFIFIAALMAAAVGGYFLVSDGKGKKGKDKDKAAVKTEKTSNNVYDVAKTNAFDPGTLPDGRNLFIMGWDGAGRERVLPLMKEGKLPNLKKFLDEGAIFVPMNISGPTHTVPVWTSVFTGLDFEQTGVAGNHKMKDLSDGGECKIKTAYIASANVYPGMKFWLEKVPYEHTIIDPIQKGGYKIGWFISKRNISEAGALAEIQKKADATLLALTGPEDEEDPKKEVNVNYIEDLYKEAKKFVETNKRFIAFYHVNPDSYGHAYTPDSEEFRNEIIRADKFFGEMLKIIDRKTTKVIVIADHGFNDPYDGYGHTNAPWAWLATDLPIDPVFQKYPVAPRDVAYTIETFYGIDPAKRKPVQRGHSLLKEEVF